MRSKLPARCLALAFMLVPALAVAHSSPEAVAGGFVLGAVHPFSGPDHLLAMLAVGLWAAQKGGRCLWSFPAAFATLMLAGAVGGMAGGQSAYAEQGIVASLLVFGLMVSGVWRTASFFSVLLVAVFAVFHGYAHGAEIPATSDVFAYSIGFLISTVLLHGAGIGMATLARYKLTRLLGIGIALSGVYFAVA